MQPTAPLAPSKLAHTAVLAETVAAPTLAADQDRSPIAVSIVQDGPARSSARTTVLPRIEVNGAQAQIVFDGKERFEKLRLLGEGGLGEVVGALDHDIGRKVAIKRLHAHVKSPASLARFVDEIRTIGKLEHPNIIPIHDVGTDATGDLYFVMKYVDGETLESIIQKLADGDREYHRIYTFERRVEIFRALLEALAFAHDKGIVHRDIKPANVMIGRYGEVLLMDWGVAKSLTSPGVELPFTDVSAPATMRSTARAFETQVGSIVGTPFYMSPEQAAGKPADARSDIYSVCLLFYELLYLRHPLTSKTTLDEVLTAVRTEPIDVFDRVSPHQPPVPVELMWFLKRGLEKDPSSRRASVREMIDVLERRADGDICVDCPVTLAKGVTMKSARLIDKHPIAMITAASAFALFFLTILVIAIRSIA
ncbi:MAG: serine/threonine-protein kinase [Polyangiaceae bacterium]